MPVTTPLKEEAAATAVLLLLQVPETHKALSVTLLSVMEDPAQTEVGPVLGARETTVIKVVAEHARPRV
jgi:hypothetical protein